MKENNRHMKTIFIIIYLIISIHANESVPCPQEIQLHNDSMITQFNTNLFSIFKSFDIPDSLLNGFISGNFKKASFYDTIKTKEISDLNFSEEYNINSYYQISKSSILILLRDETWQMKYNYTRRKIDTTFSTQKKDHFYFYVDIKNSLAFSDYLKLTGFKITQYDNATLYEKSPFRIFNQRDNSEELIIFRNKLGKDYFGYTIELVLEQCFPVTEIPTRSKK